MSFEEWFEDNKCDDLIDNKSIIKESYEAGAQSRQDEVNELQKNFNNALKTIEIQQRFLDDADGANKLLTSQVDELQKRLAMYEREGYKLVPVEPTKKMEEAYWDAYIDVNDILMPSTIYKAMIGAVDDKTT